MYMIMMQTADELTKILTLREVTIAGVLVAFLLYQIWEKRQLKKALDEKDDTIKELIDKVENSLNENSKNLVSIIEKYHLFVEQLKSLLNV